jgi:drug/metabolite transporter (DMT)-like permease
MLFWLPALCDLTATTVSSFLHCESSLVLTCYLCAYPISYQLMNIGLLYTPVSIYQMTRGALVLFVGILSVLFLKRRLFAHQWFALSVVVAGVAVVGLSGSLTKQTLADNGGLLNALLRRREETPDEVAVVIGVFFVLFAQIGTAIQFVLEEKIMATYSVTPLVAVGLEGFFGLLTLLLLFPIIIQFKDQSAYFDLGRGFHQMISNPPVLGSAFAIACSIGFYNFFGMSVTRHISATMRSIIDTCRTISIWIISLGLGWEVLVWPWSLMQVTGFSLLVYGTFLFNSLISPPRLFRPSETIEYEAIPTEEEGVLERSIVIEDRDNFVGRSLDEAATLPADIGVGYDVIPPSATSKTHRD